MSKRGIVLPSTIVEVLACGAHAQRQVASPGPVEVCDAGVRARLLHVDGQLRLRRGDAELDALPLDTYVGGGQLGTTTSALVVGNDSESAAVLVVVDFAEGIPAPTLVGRWYNMPGGGLEVPVNRVIPPELLRRVR